MLKFLRKEIVALTGELAAVITVLSQAASEIHVPSWLNDSLLVWRHVLTSMWQLCLSWLQITVHPNLAAALALALFLTLIGIGARMARGQSRTPLAPIEARFLNDMSVVSMLIYAGLVYVFLIGTGPIGEAAPQAELFSSELANRYTYALIITVGYAVGDFMGHKAFHRRLFRMAILLAALIASLVPATVAAG